MGVVEVRRDQDGWSYRLVQTWDGLYTPVAVRYPAGEGRRPLVLLSFGNGGGGLERLAEDVERRGLVADRLVDAGFAVAWLRYRAEVDLGYAEGGALERGWRSGGPLFNRSPLDHEDVLAVVSALAEDPGVDPDRIGFLGVSHGGELALKMLAGTDHGLAAAVAAEPAAHEFLAVQRGAEDVEHLQVDDVARLLARCDLDLARERIAGIDRPVLVMGRETDPLQPVFQATHQLLAEAGAPVRWTSHDHAEHGYLTPRRDDDGAYADLAGSERAIDEAIAYLVEVL